MTANGISVALADLETPPRASSLPSTLRFELARPEDNPELQQFSDGMDMSGAIRFAFDRTPDYLAALRVEGRQTEVLVCRDTRTGRLVATGHRAVKTAFVNGEPAAVGYLGGLRVAEAARSGQLLSRGYAHLRALHAQGPAQLYLTTIMEDNPQAKAVLLSGRLGLPAYHDFGRFCCMAVSLQARRGGRAGSPLALRRATSSDATAVIAFLNDAGRAKQFFPEYCAQDFGCPGGLLSGLDWKDILLAFRGQELAGMLGAWDQRALRRWRVTGYAPWLRLLRVPLNLVARFRQMPLLPRPGSPLDYFILSVVCIRDNDCDVFEALLQEMICAQRGHYGFLLAGLHERDPLLPVLLSRPHVPLSSRLYVVAWEDGRHAVQQLDRGRVPYLELGSL